MDNPTVAAGIARRLAREFPPVWEIPPDLRWFVLPDQTHLAYCNMMSDERSYLALRKIVADRLESIENGSHYAMGMGEDSYYNYRNSNATRFSLDRAEAYTQLWWIDMWIQVGTAPPKTGEYLRGE